MRVIQTAALYTYAVVHLLLLLVATCHCATSELVSAISTSTQAASGNDTWNGSDTPTLTDITSSRWTAGRRNISGNVSSSTSPEASSCEGNFNATSTTTSATSSLPVDLESDQANPTSTLRLPSHRDSQKIAFLFLVRGPMPLLPLWERFLQSHQHRASVYVHASAPGYQLQVTPGSAFWGSQIAGTKVKWGTIGLVTATKRLLTSALEDPSNQRFVLLSESCIPIRSFDFVHSYLFSSNRSFVTSLPVVDLWRYSRCRWVNKTLIPPDAFRKGSQWLALVRPHAAAIATDIIFYNEWRAARMAVPDESYINSVVPMLFPGEFEPRSVTYVRWGESGNAAHPHMFKRSGVTKEAIRAMQEEVTPAMEVVGLHREKARGVERCTVGGREVPCFLFARKFSGACLGVLMKHSPMLGY